MENQGGFQAGGMAKVQKDMREKIQYIFEGPFQILVLAALAAFTLFVIGPPFQVAVFAFGTWLNTTWFGKSWICTTLVGQSIILFVAIVIELSLMGLLLVL